MEELIWALKNGDMDGVKTTVESKGFDVNAQLDGRAPIHHAADYGQLEVLQYLSSKGADLNAVDKHGISPLLAAIWEGHTKCVQFMISQGANKNGAAPDGTSYIDSSEKDEIKLLLR